MSSCFFLIKKTKWKLPIFMGNQPYIQMNRISFLSARIAGVLVGIVFNSTLQAQPQTIIRNITLLDVEKQKAVPNATVEITGSTITAVKTKPDKKTPLYPADTRLIDGTGLFLLPGMTDAHIHFFQSGGLYTRPDALDLRKFMPYDSEINWNLNQVEDVMRRNLRAGITSVFDVGATNNLLKKRDSLKDKPQTTSIYMSGPLLTTYEPAVFKNLGDNAPFQLVKNEEEGIRAVQEQLRYKPDFVKIWYIVDQGKNKEASARKHQPVVKAIIDECHKNNVKVAVHATERITAQLAVESGCDFLVHGVEDEIITESFAQLLKDKKVTLCPTLIVRSNYDNVYGQYYKFSAHELQYANPVQLGSLMDLRHLPLQAMIKQAKQFTRNDASRGATTDSICRVNLKKLADAGVRIAAGTDAGNVGTFHGASYLGELLAMQKSGLNSWQVLQSATIHPAYILNKEKQTGSVAAGKTADLVLLKANPLEQLENLEQISLVINKGMLINPDTLIKESAEELVQRQLNAYNAHHLDAFLNTYADDVEIYEFPSKLLYKGKEQMRKDYAFLNTTPNLHCEIKKRIVQGNTIIDNESVSGFGGKPLEAVAIYQVEKGKIRKVFFVQ